MSDDRRSGSGVGFCGRRAVYPECAFTLIDRKLDIPLAS